MRSKLEANRREIKYVSTSAGLVMRTGPGVEHQKVVILPNGTPVELIDRQSESMIISGRTGHWVRIAAGGREGWVFDAFLSTAKLGDSRLDRELLNAVSDKAYDFGRVKVLLTKGANPNAMSNRPVLHYVAGRCNISEIDYLVKHGANINGRAIYHPRPTFIFEFDVPDCVNYQDILAYYFAHGGKIDTMQLENIWDEDRKSLFHKRYSAHIRDEKGENLLQLCQYGDSEDMYPRIVSLLSDASLSRYQSPYSGGTTPLMMASHYCNRRTIALLVEKGADINAQDSSGDTVFHHLRGTANAGVDECSADVFRYLRNKGGNPKVRNHAGDLPEQQ